MDLGIVHPDRPGDFLVGVECDGATYHSGATARDRDKVRAAVLEGLGWNLLRVWSTDWFTNPEGEIERLDAALRELYKSSRSANESDIKQTDISDVPSTPDNIIEIADEVTPSEPLAMVASSPSSTTSEPTEVVQDDPQTPATTPEVASKANYITTDFASLQPKIDPDLFYDDAYTSTLVEMIEHTLESEAPISDELLVQRIARAHDFKRSGRRIREKLLELIDEHFHLREDPVEGSFIWKTPDGPATHSVYRSPTNSQSTRRIEEIPYEEISAAHRDRNTDATDIARTFGIKRLTANVRDRIERAIAIAQS
ncbi:DUF3320 domain-containing protein [Rubritalea profundi]|uniref:DUF3320 domain-containing protein n=1 Tax=Rubritalea profundi TaxID=1658618 RepID=UPI001F0C6480|nr:DUF3320 domain-containing protein [Rubritalea profundi]